MQRLFTLIFLSATILNAQAESQIWREQLNFEATYLGPAARGGVDSYTYYHDLKVDGFIPGKDTVSDYIVRVRLSDDSEWDWNEWAYISQPGLLGDKKVRVSHEDINLGASILGLLSLNENGTLEITINRVKGDFLLDSSQLKAKFEPTVDVNSQ